MLNRLPFFVLSFQFVIDVSFTDVRLPPRITLLRISPPQPLPGQPRYYRTDDTITLECDADGVPKPELSWYFNNAPSSLNNNVSPTGRGTIVINNAHDFNEGEYKCLAENQHGKAISNTTRLVRAQLAQYGPDKSVTDSVEMEEGTPYKLSCTPTKCIPRPTFSWAITGSTEDYSQENVIYDKRMQMDDNGNLHISYLLTSDFRDGKLYKCNLGNPILDLTIGGSYQRINVKEIPGGIKPFKPILLFDTIQTKVFVEGSNISLKCFFSAYPEMTSVRWIRKNENGIAIPMPVGRHKLTNYNFELTIYNLQAEDQGQYWCVATNIAGETSHNINLEVEASPIFQDYSKRPHNMNVTEGDTAVFNCDPYAKPRASITWWKNAEKLDLEHLPAKYHISGDRKQLSIGPVCKTCSGVESDLSVIQCEAKNIHGSSFTDGYLNILKRTEIVHGLPEKIEIKKDGAVMSIEMSCESNSDQSTPILTRWFHQRPMTKDPLFVSLYAIPNKVMFSANNQTVTLMVRNASEWDEHAGLYRCNASNLYSSQTSVTSLTVLDVETVTEMPVVVNQQAGMLWWLLILVAAILLLLLLLLCCCICCYRNRGDVYLIDKKEKSTDCDSALIPRLCVHG